MEIWLHYYNAHDPDSRPLGRVRVMKYVGVWSLSIGAYRRIMKTIRDQDPDGWPAFIGPPSALREPVCLVSWKINPDGSDDISKTFINNIGSVF